MILIIWVTVVFVLLVNYLNNQMYLGFMRIERIVRERFRMQEVHSALMPQDFLNVKPLGAVIREFFGTGTIFSIYGSNESTF